MTSTRTAERKIGPWGAAARFLVGAGMVIGAVVIGIDALDALLGLVAFPLAVSIFVAIRGRAAESLRLTGPDGHCIVCALAVAQFVLVPVAALLFNGTSMLLAALRGYGGCELFAISNWLWGRDDQIGCPIFHPVDVAEARSGHGTDRPQPQC